jgi:hypothetical protein
MTALENFFDFGRLRLEPNPFERRFQVWKVANMRLDFHANIGPGMSPILPISFLVTLLCVIGAIDGVLFQQLLFVGAAVAATILVCSLEAWSSQGAAVRSEDEANLHRGD